MRTLQFAIFVNCCLKRHALCWVRWRQPVQSCVTFGVNWLFLVVFFSIDCFYNDMDKTYISIWPIVLDQSDFSLLLNDDVTGDFFFNDGLGGDVASDVTISRQAQPYLVERSIFVLYVNVHILIHFLSTDRFVVHISYGCLHI